MIVEFEGVKYYLHHYKVWRISWENRAAENLNLGVNVTDNKLLNELNKLRVLEEL